MPTRRPSEQCVKARLEALTPDEYRHLIGSSSILRGMIKHNIPLTRENYVAIANAGRPDEAWTAEHEMMLPWIFRQLDDDMHGIDTDDAQR
jgi:hypothetical protein